MACLFFTSQDYLPTRFMRPFRCRGLGQTSRVGFLGLLLGIYIRSYYYNFRVEGVGTEPTAGANEDTLLPSFLTEFMCHVTVKKMNV